MLVGLLRTMRPHQWVKNLFVLAPLVFAKELMHLPMALAAAAGFALFSLASSTVYILNDLADVEADRAHPVKRTRPIASGVVSERTARIAGVGMGAFVLAAGLLLSPPFTATVLGYLVLNFAYTFKLKRIAYIDVLCIAAGFELRVLAGAYAAEVEPSLYLLTVTLLLAMFLGFGKRMHELMQGEAAHKQRSVLKAYSARTLTVLLYATGLATIGTYVVYTVDPHTRRAFGTDYLAATTLFMVFGIFRFLHLVRGRPHSESPTEEMLRDKPFLLNALLCAVAVVVIIYLG